MESVPNVLESVLNVWESVQNDVESVQKAGHRLRESLFHGFFFGPTEAKYIREARRDKLKMTMCCVCVQCSGLVIT